MIELLVRLRREPVLFFVLFTFVVATWWGLWLVNPYSSVYAASRSFEGFKQVAPEAVWGTALALGGICGIVSLVRCNDRVVRVLIGWMAVLWTSVAAGFIHAWESTGFPVYWTLAVFTSLSYLALSDDA